MKNENLIINCLYIGSTLENLELLTLHSFIAQGHIVHLWVYQTPQTPLIDGVILKDANEIIPEKAVFRYKYNDPTLNQGKGSFAGFSDIFRYKLLYDKGGWWSDMDITCLQKLDIKEPYFFKANNNYPARGSLMKCPQGSPLMKTCYEEALLTVTESNQAWMEPIRILNDNIKKLGLSAFIKKNRLNEDDFNIIKLYLNLPKKLSSNWYAVHWMNECWRINAIAKDKAVKNSVYGFFLDKYNLPYQTVASNLEPRWRIIFRWIKYILFLLTPQPLITIYRSFKKSKKY